MPRPAAISHASPDSPLSDSRRLPVPDAARPPGRPLASDLRGLDDMTERHLARSAGRAIMYGAAVAAGACAAYAGTTWLRYGRVAPAGADDVDPMLDQFMPGFEVAERHHAAVSAPADLTYAAACDVDLQRSAIVRSVFKAREVALGADADETPRPRGIVALTKSLGWGVLAEIPGREIVMGAVTQPWQANVTFRALPPETFAAFNEPGYVKIVWSLRADPVSASKSIARTETRVTTTDPGARQKFRRYWSVFSPGIVLIRRVLLRLVKSDAERRARERSIHADRLDATAARPI